MSSIAAQGPDSFTGIAPILACAYLRLLSARQGDGLAIVPMVSTGGVRIGSLSLDVPGHQSPHDSNAKAPLGQDA